MLSKTSTSNRRETISTVPTVEIVSLRSLWTKGEVKKRIQTISKDADLEVKIIQNVYYPYLQFVYELIVKGTGGKALCFVDMVGGVEAISTALPKMESVRVPKIQIMPCKVDPEVAQRKAETYITYVFTHRRKVLIAPELLIRSKKLVYRPFFILKCNASEKKKSKFYLMFDAVSGQYQTLSLGTQTTAKTTALKQTSVEVEQMKEKTTAETTVFKQRVAQVEGVKEKLRKAITGEL